MSIQIESVESRLLLSATPTFTALQRKDLRRIGSDLMAIVANSSVTANQRKAIISDLTSIIAVAHKPSSGTLQTLKSTAKAAFSDKKISIIEGLELASATQAVLDSAGVPSALVSQTRSDFSSIFLTAGISKKKLHLIVSDIKSLLGTFKK